MSRCDIQTVSSSGKPANSSDSTAVKLRLAELGGTGSLDRAAEIQRQQLRAVADAECRNAEREHFGIDVRSAFGVHRCGPAAEDQRMRVSRAHLSRRHAVSDEL